MEVVDRELCWHNMNSIEQDVWILKLIREVRCDDDIDLIIKMMNTQTHRSEEMMTLFTNFCMRNQRFSEILKYLKANNAKMYLGKTENSGNYWENTYYVKFINPNQKIITPTYL